MGNTKSVVSRHFIGLIFVATFLALGFLVTAKTDAAQSLGGVLQQFEQENPGSAVVVKEIGGDAGASVNPGSTFTAASLYKLFVAEYLYVLQERGDINFDQKFPLADVNNQWDENVADCRGNQACVTAIWPTKPTGKQASVDECLPKMIIFSDNICGKTFLDIVRSRGVYPYLSSEGYNDTSLAPSGLKTSAQNVAKLMNSIAKGDWVNKDASDNLYALLKRQYHRSKIPAGVPAGQTANKTGELHGSNYSHDAAIIKSNGKTYVLVVLTRLDPDDTNSDKKIADLSAEVYDIIVGSNESANDESIGQCGPAATPSRSIYKSLYAPFYDPGFNACCADSLGGAADGGPLLGVHFPAVSDTAALEQTIREYIKKVRPKSPLITPEDYSDDFVRLGQEYNVNPIISVMIAQVEYQFGTLSQFVGPGAPGQYNFWAVTYGNTPGVRFGAYPSIAAAMEDHFKLLAGKRPQSVADGISYIGPPQNFTTISQIMNQYAPASENDTAGYIKVIVDGLKKLLGGGLQATPNNVTDTPSAADCAQQAANELGGEAIVIDGYAFPIAAKHKSDYDTFGALSAVPCNNAGGCHHNEAGVRAGYAFDLGVKGFGPDRSQNAPVYAISDGVLVGVRYIYHGNPCNSLEFKSDKDGYVYWYGHLAVDNSIKVSQRFQAGQQIGKVGPTACALGTAPHLHIDRGYPKGEFGGSECCRDQGIIPLINKLFEALPN